MTSGHRRDNFSRALEWNVEQLDARLGGYLLHAKMQ